MIRTPNRPASTDIWPSAGSFTPPIGTTCRRGPGVEVAPGRRFYSIPAMRYLLPGGW